MTTRNRHELVIADVVQETPDAISIAFEVPAVLAPHFTYRPGQFLTLRVPSELTGSVARCYSLCSSPSTDTLLRVAVKRTVDGYASNWLCDNAVAGMAVEVLEPSGSFGPQSYENHVLLFAAGSGITPVIAIAKSVLDTGLGHVALFYANRDEASVIFGAELAVLERQHAGRLTVAHWIESERGLPTVTALQDFADAYPDHAAYACGPKGFMTAVQDSLAQSTPPRTAHVENFVSLARNPFEVSESDEPAVPVGEMRTSVIVDLYGSEHRLLWPDGMPLLELMLTNGLDAPFACQEGTCGSCTCHVDEGVVVMVHNDALDQSDLDDGYVLACQARPQGGNVRISYD